MNQLFKSKLLPAEEYNTVQFPPSYKSLFNVYISPDNIETRKIADGISSSYIQKFIFGSNIDDLREKYLNDFTNTTTIDVDNAFGLAFSESINSFPYEYTLLVKYDSKLFNNNKKINYFTDTRSCRNRTNSFLNQYENCGGNQFAYNGLAHLQNVLNNFIRKVFACLT